MKSFAVFYQNNEADFISITNVTNCASGKHSWCSVTCSPLDFNDGISWMRDFGIFEKLASDGVPISATEESAKKTINEQADELSKLKLEAFYGPLILFAIGLIGASVILLAESISPEGWLKSI